jgi:hypothetical protein
MKVLNLIIKQKFFDEIISGNKKHEFREVTPKTIKKYLQLDEDGYELEDENGQAIPIKYDAIQFYVGYRKDRDSALVEVKDAVCEIEFNEFDNPIIYEYEGEEWVRETMVYTLGKVLD